MSGPSARHWQLVNWIASAGLSTPFPLTGPGLSPPPNYFRSVNELYLVGQQRVAGMLESKKTSVCFRPAFHQNIACAFFSQPLHQTLKINASIPPGKNLHFDTTGQADFQSLEHAMTVRQNETVRNTAARAGTACSPASTTLISRFPGIREVNRGVRRGLSLRTVPIPTIMASARTLKQWAYLRAGKLDIHREAPVEQAILPSTESAALLTTKGMPVVMRLIKTAFTLRAFSPSNPVSTRIPDLRSNPNPLPDTIGFGSRMEQTTRLIPAALSARAQGGVFPK